MPEYKEHTSLGGTRFVTFDSLSVDLEPSQLAWPRNLAAASGNRDFVDLSETDWGEVREVIAAEGVWTTHGSGSGRLDSCRVAA